MEQILHLSVQQKLREGAEGISRGQGARLQHIKNAKHGMSPGRRGGRVFFWDKQDGFHMSMTCWSAMRITLSCGHSIIANNSTMMPSMMSGTSQSSEFNPNATSDWDEDGDDSGNMPMPSQKVSVLSTP